MADYTKFCAHAKLPLMQIVSGNKGVPILKDAGKPRHCE